MKPPSDAPMCAAPPSRCGSIAVQGEVSSGRHRQSPIASAGQWLQAWRGSGVPCRRDFFKGETSVLTSHAVGGPARVSNPQSRLKAGLQTKPPDSAIVRTVLILRLADLGSFGLG